MDKGRQDGRYRQLVHAWSSGVEAMESRREQVVELALALLAAFRIESEARHVALLHPRDLKDPALPPEYAPRDALTQELVVWRHELDLITAAEVTPQKPGLEKGARAPQGSAAGAPRGPKGAPDPDQIVDLRAIAEGRSEEEVRLFTYVFNVGVLLDSGDEVLPRELFLVPVTAYVREWPEEPEDKPLLPAMRVVKLQALGKVSEGIQIPLLMQGIKKLPAKEAMAISGKDPAEDSLRKALEEINVVMSKLHGMAGQQEGDTALGSPRPHQGDRLHQGARPQEERKLSELTAEERLVLIARRSREATSWLQQLPFPPVGLIRELGRWWRRGPRTEKERLELDLEGYLLYLRGSEDWMDRATRTTKALSGFARDCVDAARGWLYARRQGASAAALANVKASRFKAHPLQKSGFTGPSIDASRFKTRWLEKSGSTDSSREALREEPDERRTVLAPQQLLFVNFVSQP